MKLRELNKLNCGYAKAAKPTLSFTVKSGLIRIGKEVCETLNVKEGDAIKFLQDEENPEDFFISKSTKDVGFVVRYNSSKSTFLLNAKKIANVLSDLSEIDNKGVLNVVMEPRVINK